MLFEGLSEKLQSTIKKIRSSGRVTEKDVKAMAREIKLALLEADVNFRIVKEFVGKISERAVGRDVLESLTPGQQVVKIVHEELVRLMGTVRSKLTYSSAPPSVYLVVGLQGSGKTTTAGKLANLLRKEGKSPLLVACDVYRPAAIKQLQVVGKQLNIPVFEMDTEKSPVDIAKEGFSYAKLSQKDVVIIDTAGRLHIDETLMSELGNIKQTVNPQEVLLVVDAMTGQDAVNIAEAFNKKLGIDGIILTKLDGDTRGGAALSVRYVTQKPVKFVGIGEKLGDIEVFHPERMASRILGMGDILSLIEKAQKGFNEKKALELERKIRTQQFTLEDYLEQIQHIKSMGPISQIIGMLPGINQKALKGVNLDDRQMIRTEAIIRSMTVQERLNPSIINASRKKRIAKGSGTSVQEVNQLLKQFENLKKMMKKMATSKGLKSLGSMGGFGIKF